MIRHDRFNNTARKRELKIVELSCFRTCININAVLISLALLFSAALPQSPAAILRQVEVLGGTSRRRPVLRHSIRSISQWLRFSESKGLSRSWDYHRRSYTEHRTCGYSCPSGLHRHGSVFRFSSRSTHGISRCCDKITRSR